MAGAGLCAACRQAQLVTSSRGSRRPCGRVGQDQLVAAVDPRYPKYPALPVLRCAAFQPRPAGLEQ